MRHGRTEANIQGLMCGSGWDIPLHDEGIKQAQRVAAIVPTLKIPIEEIYVSPMQRAQQTAKIVNAPMNLPINIVHNIREWDLGEWEKIPWNTLPHIFNHYISPPAGENTDQFSKRAVEAVASILYNTNKVPLIVSHGGIANFLLKALGLGNRLVENCQLCYLQFEKESNCYNLEIFNH